jgi:hypothetical protein
MDSLAKRPFIRQKAKENQHDRFGRHILWSRHAIAEAINDNLSRSEIELALVTAEIVEDYPTSHRPLPDCLVLGYLPDERPIHAVVAIDEANDRIFLVTVYLPSEEKWYDDWRRRK